MLSNLTKLIIISHSSLSQERQLANTVADCCFIGHTLLAQAPSRVLGQLVAYTL
jgi:hypothetical protein